MEIVSGSLFIRLREGCYVGVGEVLRVDTVYGESETVTLPDGRVLEHRSTDMLTSHVRISLHHDRWMTCRHVDTRQVGLHTRFTVDDADVIETHGFSVATGSGTLDPGLSRAARAFQSLSVTGHQLAESLRRAGTAFYPARFGAGRVPRAQEDLHDAMRLLMTVDAPPSGDLETIQEALMAASDGVGRPQTEADAEPVEGILPRRLIRIRRT